MADTLLAQRIWFLTPSDSTICAQSFHQNCKQDFQCVCQVWTLSARYWPTICQIPTSLSSVPLILMVMATQCKSCQACRYNCRPLDTVTAPGQLHNVSNRCSVFLNISSCLSSSGLLAASSACPVEVAACDQPLPTAVLSAGMYMLLIA